LVDKTERNLTRLTGLKLTSPDIQYQRTCTSHYLLTVVVPVQCAFLFSQKHHWTPLTFTIWIKQQLFFF